MSNDGESKNMDFDKIVGDYMWKGETVKMQGRYVTLCEISKILDDAQKKIKELKGR